VLEYTRPLWDDLAGSRMLITGGTGFVGKWLLESLMWANQRLNLGISAFVLTRDPERFRSASPHLTSHNAITLLAGDAGSFEFPQGEFQFVIHAATESHFDATVDQPVSTFDRDVEATRRVLEFARMHGVRRLLFTSSGAAYGKQPPEITHVTEDYPGGPQTVDTGTAYGQAKRTSEFLCAMYARQYDFKALIGRLFAFVGPHLPLDRNFAVGNFIRDALSGGPIRISGDGTPYRSYLYAADLAVWLWTILARGESGRLYNVGSDHFVTISELGRAVADVTAADTHIEIASKPVAGAIPSRYVPSIARARSELGLAPVISLEEGLRRTWQWIRASDCGEMALKSALLGTDVIGR